jgi:hypothetical protein
MASHLPDDLDDESKSQISNIIQSIQDDSYKVSVNAEILSKSSLDVNVIGVTINEI